jgi:hypothetical protein
MLYMPAETDMAAPPEAPAEQGGVDHRGLLSPRRHPFPRSAESPN